MSSLVVPSVIRSWRWIARAPVQKINCPSCGEPIVNPAGRPLGRSPGGRPRSQWPARRCPTVNPIASSAAAKVEMHLRVPVHKTPTQSLIEKPLVPLEVAKDADKVIRIKTIRHTDCIEVGHDRFDEMVSNFLAKVGETNIISINTIGYTNLDIGTQKIMTEYGVLIVFKG